MENDLVRSDVPRISVVMTVFNAENYISQAIDSILNQTFQNFELIVIDDGSEDATPEILKKYVGRIRNIRQINRGASAASNLGLREARGEFIARLDADDIAGRDRLAKQVGFFDIHPAIGLLGTSGFAVDERGHRMGMIKVPQNDLAIRWELLLRNPFIHSSIMFRRELLNNLDRWYDPKYVNVGDYGLFSNMLNFTKAHNLQNPLVSYRIHRAGISQQYFNQLIDDHLEISSNQLKMVFEHKNFNWVEFSDLIRMIAGGAHIDQKLRKRRASLVLPFLSIWDLFEEQNNSANGLKKVKRNMALQASRMALQPMFQKDMMKALGRISMYDRYWWFNYLVQLGDPFQYWWMKFRFRLS